MKPSAQSEHIRACISDIKQQEQANGREKAFEAAFPEQLHIERKLFEPEEHQEGIQTTQKIEINNEVTSHSNS